MQVAFIPKENCVAEIRRIGGTLKRSASAVWIFKMDFQQKEVNQDSVAVLFVFYWHVSAFFFISDFSLF